MNFRHLKFQFTLLAALSLAAITFSSAVIACPIWGCAPATGGHTVDPIAKEKVYQGPTSRFEYSPRPLRLFLDSTAESMTSNQALLELNIKREADIQKSVSKFFALIRFEVMETRYGNIPEFDTLGQLVNYMSYNRRGTLRDILDKHKHLIFRNDSTPEQRMWIAAIISSVTGHDSNIGHQLALWQLARSANMEQFERGIMIYLNGAGHRATEFFKALPTVGYELTDSRIKTIYQFGYSVRHIDQSVAVASANFIFNGLTPKKLTQAKFDMILELLFSGDQTDPMISKELVAFFYRYPDVLDYNIIIKTIATHKDFARWVDAFINP